MERSHFLQVMRFVAAALVLCTHTTFYYHERVDPTFAVWEPGGVGVLIFFVISGIVMVISTENFPIDAHGAKAFMVRRITRIVPLYWIVTGIKVVVAIALPSVVNHNYFQFDHAIKSFLFIPYFNAEHGIAPLHGVGWTLVHEMYFYVLFTIALLLRLKPVMAVSIAIGGLCFVGAWLPLDSALWVVATSPLNLHFVLGMLVGWLVLNSRGKPALRLSFGLGMAALAAVVVSLSSVLGPYAEWAPMFAFSAATLLLFGIELPRKLSLFSKLGDSSYSLYLFHPFLAPASLLVLARLTPQLHPVIQIAIAMALTIAAAHLLHLVVERPAVRIAKRLLPDARVTSKNAPERSPT